MVTLVTRVTMVAQCARIALVTFVALDTRVAVITWCMRCPYIFAYTIALSREAPNAFVPPLTFVT